MANLKRKHALVTGGAGFMGSQIVDLLCDEDCAEIVVFNNMVRGRWEHLEQAGAQVVCCKPEPKNASITGIPRNTHMTSKSQLRAKAVFTGGVL